MEPKWGTSDDLSKFLRPGGKSKTQRIFIRHKSHGLMSIQIKHRFEGQCDRKEAIFIHHLEHLLMANLLMMKIS